MPRPPEAPNRDDLSPEEQGHYDQVVTREQGWSETPGPYWAAVLNWPAYAATLATQGNLVKTTCDREDSYSHADREWVDQVLYSDWKTNVVLRLHTPDALAVGVRLEAIEALRAGREEDLTEDEQFLTTYIRQVYSGTVTDESYAKLEQRLGERGAVEYTLFIGHLIRTIRLHQAFAVPDPQDSEIDQMHAEFKKGTRRLPNFRERIG